MVGSADIESKSAHQLTSGMIPDHVKLFSPSPKKKMKGGGGLKNENFMSSNKNRSDVSGLLGESLRVRKVNGDVVVKNKPERKMTTQSAKQILIKEKFLEASAWAKEQLEKPESKAFYKAAISGKLTSAYMVAVSDYLNAPKVKGIDTRRYKGAIGDKIVVNAFDEFGVTRVEVFITDAAGNVIEQGEAPRDAERKFYWNYIATAANVPVTGTKILAIAYDKPGNEGSLEIAL
jgi:hypothetical protein